MNFNLLSVLFVFISITGCASFSHEKYLDLSVIEKTNWHLITTKNAEGFFGVPDIKEAIPNSQYEEVWIYLDGNPQSTKLSLIFLTNSGALQSANWFFRQNEKPVSLEYLMNRYGKRAYQEQNVKKQETTPSPKMKFYSHNGNGPEIAVYTKSGLVSSLSWEVNPSPAQTKRSPTSH